ncbi:polysialyltransferase family glycosyltransferase [Streptomyces sp. NPDC007971]|uniref:polysialyltransferase family glycosyltransferase n=1 Tax=Streptomyces sp. NPDC007971 TaxID=3364799 RepID=UPI0036E82FDE
MAATQLFCACTQYAAATVTAAVRAGLFGPRSEHRRILVVSDQSTVPEIGTRLDRMPGFGALEPEFDEVRSWNEFIQPYHPAHWAPREHDMPLWQRVLRQTWNLGTGDIEIACESIQGRPSHTVAQIFSESPIHVYADGLMSYGPTRKALDPQVAKRIRRLLLVDLVPGLRPLLLSEFGVEPEHIPSGTFTDVLRELAAHADGLWRVVPHESPALLLGQYLSAIDVLSAEEERGLHLRMLRGVARLGHRFVVFKPHPSAPPDWSRDLEEEAARLGVAFRVLAEPVLAEVIYQRMRPALVVGCFSTALLTASSLFRLPVARIGTQLLLGRLTPYQNSNRIPVTIVDALLPELDDASAVDSWSLTRSMEEHEELADLIAAVGFVMQPDLHPRLRATAERYLATHVDDPVRRYFHPRRLYRLGLPGGVPHRHRLVPRTRLVRRVARGVRSVKRAVFDRS